MNSLSTEKLVAGALICLLGLMIAYIIRNSTTSLKRDAVVERLDVLNAVKGVVYDKEELFENVLSFSVPITISVGQGNVDLSALDDAIRSVGGHLIGVANSAEPNTRNLSVRLPKNVGVGCFLKTMSAAINFFSVAGLMFVAWALLV